MLIKFKSKLEPLPVIWLSLLKAFPECSQKLFQPAVAKSIVVLLVQPGQALAALLHRFGFSESPTFAAGSDLHSLCRSVPAATAGTSEAHFCDTDSPKLFNS